MNFTKQAKPGFCRRMRCKNTSAGTVGEYEICGEHMQETLNYLSGVTNGSGFVYLTPEADAPPSPEDILEEAAQLEDFEPADSDEFVSLVGVLHEAIDRREALDTTRKEQGAPHHKAWKAVNDKFKGALEAFETLVDTAKAVILTKRLEQEGERDAAISRGDSVPVLFEAPGLSFPAATLVVSLENIDQVPEEYLCVSVDLEKAHAAILADPKKQIPGIQAEWERSVSFRRPDSDKS